MKNWEPHIAVRAVQPVVAALETLGYPSDEILKEAAPIRSFEVHAYAALSSSTLRKAYRRASRYQRLIHEATDLAFEESVNEGVLRHALPDGRAVPCHPAEFLATLWVRVGRLVTGEDWNPSLVCFAHQEPKDVREHARVFRAPLQFSSGRTAMHIPNAILDMPSSREDANLASLLDRYAEGLLKQLPRRSNFSERARAALLKELNGGAPIVAALAKALHMSQRSSIAACAVKARAFARCSSKRAANEQRLCWPIRLAVSPKLDFFSASPN